MDIQTKDGILLRGVPDGTPDEAIKARIAKIRSESAAPKKAPAMFTPSGEKEMPVGDMIAGNPVTRFAMGAASPILGAWQLGLKKNPVSRALGQDAWLDDKLQTVEAMKQRGMELSGDKFDAAGLAGAVLSPAVLKVVQALKPAATVGQRLVQGTTLGAASGAATPVTEEGDFDAQKGTQVAVGAALGAAIPGAVDASKSLVRGARHVADLFTESGAGRILTRYQDKLIGKDWRQAVVDALKNSKEPVPGYKPTAAEAVAEVPAGSPIIAHQKITAGTPGGPSAAFGQRVIDQKAALETAAESRNAATAPMRRAALDAADNVGAWFGDKGVKSANVVTGIDATLGKPGIRASDVVGKTLNSVKEKLAAFTDEATGVISADDLYTIRKEIGNTIKTHAKETANWDKRLAAGLERDVQRAIDDAIESAGGAGWKQYLAEFSTQSKGIEAAKAGAKAAAKPVQRTNLGGGMNVAEETRMHLPNMLSRPMMMANAIMKRVGQGVEPRLDAEATRRYLNPQELAKALESVPPQQQSVISALLQRLGVIGGTQAAAGGY